MRGLSGAVTALILVVASVVIALIVVGFAFNLFGSFGSAGAVSPVGPAYLYTSSPPPNVTSAGSNAVYLLVTMNNRGPNVNITSANINGQNAVPTTVYNYNMSSQKVIQKLNGVYIPAGQDTLVIVLTGVNPSTIAGSPVNIQLSLANGQTVYVAATLAT
jgi:hypothetical protein